MEGREKYHLKNNLLLWTPVIYLVFAYPIFKMDNIAGIVFGLSLLPIFALLYSLQTFIIIENERITKFTYGAKNNSSEIQIIIMEIKKVIVKNNSIQFLPVNTKSILIYSD